MKEIVFGVFLISVVFVGLPFYALNMTGYFKPKYTEIDRKTFEESRTFNEGMVRDLENLKLAYEGASIPQKQSLRAIVLHRFSVYPQERLTPDLRKFYSSVQNEGVGQ